VGGRRVHLKEEGGVEEEEPADADGVVPHPVGGLPFLQRIRPRGPLPSPPTYSPFPGAEEQGG